MKQDRHVIAARLMQEYERQETEHKKRGERYTQKAIANACNISPNAFNNYLHGRRGKKRDIDPQILQSIARVLGVRYEYLVGIDDFRTVADLDARRANQLTAWASFLESLGYAVTTQTLLYVDCLDTLKYLWDRIQPTLTADARNIRFSDGFKSLGEWDGTTITDLCDPVDYTEPLAQWGNCSQLLTLFTVLGVPVRCCISGIDVRESGGDDWRDNSTHYAISYITERDGVKKSFSVDELEKAFGIIDANARNVIDSDAFGSPYHSLADVLPYFTRIIVE